jgi:hypothetical protein
MFQPELLAIFGEFTGFSTCEDYASPYVEEILRIWLKLQLIVWIRTVYVM